MNKVSLRASIRRSLQLRGVEWRELVRDCDQIVLFGSRAVLAQETDADIDLFCVGSRAREKNRFVDIVCYSPDAVATERWLGSELANHIAAFGVWLHGNDTWSDKVFISSRAVAYKRSLVRARVEALMRLWSSLARDYRIKHVVKLRRDIQRLALMKAGKAVEPSPWLDKRWASQGAATGGLRKILREAGEPDLSLTRNQWRRLSNYAGFLNWRSTHRAASPEDE